MAPLLFTFFTNPADHYFHVMRGITFRKLYHGNIRFIQALCAAAFFTAEMHVVIMMIVFPAIRFTDRVPHGSIGGRYLVNDPFIQESL